MDRLLESDTIAKKVKDCLDRTHNVGKEHGFNICYNNGDMIATDIEEGKKYGVNVRNSCGKTIGGFHTHTNLDVTKGYAVPSPKDINSALKSNIKFFCIGGKEKGGESDIVRCFNTENIKSEIKEIEKKIDGKISDERSARLLAGRMTEKEFLDKNSYKYSIE